MSAPIPLRRVAVFLSLLLPTIPAAPGRLLVWRGHGFVFVAPDGKEGERLPGRVDGLFLNEPVLSPDGTRVAFTVTDEPRIDADGFRRRKVLVRGLDANGAARTFPASALNVFWAPDGRHLYAVLSLAGTKPDDRGRPFTRIDPATGAMEPIELPSSVDPFGITPDDTSFVVAAYDHAVKPRKIYLGLLSRADGSVTRLTEITTKEPNARIAPDGSKILFQDNDRPEQFETNEATAHRLFVYDVTTRTRTRLAEIPARAFISGFCWSPDGKRVAYTWRRTEPGETRPHYAESKNDPQLKPGTESFLVIADPDGKNPKTVLSGAAPETTIATVDWR